MNPSLESIIGSKWNWSHLEIILRGSCKQSLNKCFSLQLYVNARYLEISTVVQYGLPKILEWLFILCSHTNDNLYFYLLYLKLIYVTDIWIKFTIKQPASLKCYWKLETVFQPMLRNAYINTRSFLLWPTAESCAARQVNPRTSVSND